MVEDAQQAERGCSREKKEMFRTMRVRMRRSPRWYPVHHAHTLPWAARVANDARQALRLQPPFPEGAYSAPWAAEGLVVVEKPPYGLHKASGS